MLSSILERARKQLLKAVDPKFIQHKQKTRKLPVDNSGGAQYDSIKKTKVQGKVQWEVIFKTDSATRSGRKTHTQRVVLLELRPLIESKRSKLTLTAKVNKAINKGDLLIGCTCEAFCLHEDTKIKLLNNEVKSVKDLKSDFDQGKKIRVYSTDKHGNFKPGVVNNIWVSGHVKKMVEVTLDNDRKILTTPEHGYMLRDGSYCQAQNLILETSLMPLYFSDYRGYEKVKLNHTEGIRNNKFVTTYGVVAREFFKKEYDKKYKELVETGIEDFLVVHHKDFNKKNNYEDNLEWMGKLEHLLFHANLIGENRKNVTEGNARYNKDPKNKEAISKRGRKAAAASIAARKEAGTYEEFLVRLVEGAKKYLNSPEGKNKFSSQMKKTWKENREHMLNQLHKLVENPRFRKIQSISMKNKITKLMRDPKFKKATDDRLRDINLNHNIMNYPDKRLLVGVGHIMSIAKETFSKFSKMTYPYYLKVLNTKQKKFKWQRYFSDFERLQYWFVEVYSNKNVNRIRKFKKLEMVEEIKSFAFNNHKIKSVRIINFKTEQPVYDISVEKYNNFYVNSGVVLHNSFWGYAWINTNLGTVHPKFKEKRPPDERNPQRRGIMCKHLALMNTVPPFNTSTIVKDLRDKGVK